MLTDEEINVNKERFESLIHSVTREGFNKEQLISMLENSDFFIAPASTEYHCSYKGGLCQHCLDVYDNMKSFMLIVPFNKVQISEDSIILVSLLHDISLMNFFTETVKNTKVYSPDGFKFETVGNEVRKYNWVAVPTYTRNDNRFIYGSHEQTSEFMASSLAPLTVEERVAILHHHGGTNWDSIKDGITDIYKTYPLACIICLANTAASFITENESLNE